MFLLILKLLAISLIPILGSIGLKLLDKYVIKEKINKWTKYIIYGVIFGIFSILGSYFGVESGEGAVINVRDVAPIVGGLVFGWPVGIIAGVLGGGFRWLSVYWGIAGEFTVYACVISTVMAGVFTALYKRFVIGNKETKWSAALFLGLLVENSHMLLVFLTRMNYPEKAYQVTANCAFPMILVTVVSSIIALVAIKLIDGEKIISFSKPPKLSTYLRRIMALSLLATFAFVSITSYILIKNNSYDVTQRTLNSSCDDVEGYVKENINDKLTDYIKNARKIVDEKISLGSTPNEVINYLLSDTKFTEINFINGNNIIEYSNKPEFVGFDMTSGEQSNEFSFLATSSDALYIQDFTTITADEGTYMRYCGITINSNTYGTAYVEAGFDVDSYTKLVNDTISTFVKHTRVMEKGFVAVADINGNIISIHCDKEDILKTLDVSKYNCDGINYIKLINNEGAEEEYTFMMKYTDGYYVLALANSNEITLNMDISFNSLTFSQITLYLLLYFVMMLIIKYTVTERISKISTALNKISDGDLNVYVDEHQSYEIDLLSKDINTTVNTLKLHAEEEKEKIEKDLKLAKQIQLSALPCSFPAFPKNPEFDLYAVMDAAKEVGGDFYDFYLVDNDHVAIQIADVSGKGIPAAMFMMKAKTILKSFVTSGLSIEKAYTKANNKLCEGNDAQMFVTAWLAVIDIRTGHVEFVSAGHNPPLLKHKNGEFEYLHFKSGFVLAAIEDFAFTKQEFDIAPGDQLFLYTDGVTEATNKELCLYGEERLKRVLDSCQEMVPRSICKVVKDSIDEFASGNEQADDITMLSFTYYGEKNTKTIEVDALTPNVDKVTEFIENFLEEIEAPTDFVMKINVVVDEIFSNIARYGFPDGKPTKVRITTSLNDDKQFVLTFTDSGIAYNPLMKEDPDITLSAEERPIGGLGIFIVKKIMDEMLYERINNQNVLTLKKNLK